MRVGVNVQARRDLSAVPSELRSVADDIVTPLAQAAADYGTPAVLTAARARRGTLSMSRNKRGSQLDALPIVRGGASRAEAEIVAVPRGAWHLVEYGSPPHVITPKRKYGGRRRAGGLPTPYGVRAKVNHPGTAPRPTWEPAMADAEPIIDEAVQRTLDELVQRTLGD